MIVISFTAILFLGLFPSQALACVQPQYWPPAGLGWLKTTPEAQGMDSGKIEEMYEFIDGDNEYFYDINIQKLIKENITPSRSEFIRTALREFLHKEYNNLTKLGYFDDKNSEYRQYKD